ncbi:aminotransferase class I/II-fold pyridoxal phosphate-dependent enzyme [Neobacillus sp. OS1-2]|uniref:aminotransferase class I/II-fold pyridoxal phosphate-dependent enzyme n=1 Tax=Neobacillus sp. OS1-2 TaxID=3070680 RepID=UPI0027E00B9A|nr:aminotransferase class I/II-fold pyridoxal phosphate-dependent enzyme [Neobacillus sp. OS1-2]WML41860.1 aminotransferase class I/II-fold pyridoxal phosphate-dependent enzyme [Neobacillus sp. OS1-2]
MKTQSKKPLYEALVEHVKKKPISFHVPGHKYGRINQSDDCRLFEQILQIDATELTGLDDLHSPEGAILEAETLLAKLYQTKESFFLVNGSTVGNLAMILAVCTEGAQVLVQRNCHKSVLNALRLVKARPVFLEPEYDQEWKIAAGVSVETVKQAINLYPNAKAIILTYPNYYGMTYDLQGIIDLCHLHQIPVLVDEAHGAHLIIGGPFPPSAVQLGADIIVQSAHKTLPAMTMGSFLHVNGNLIRMEKVKEYLGMLQSSSPSYPIMASLDIARHYLGTYEQTDLSFLLAEIRHFKEALAQIPAVKVLDFPNSHGDLLKITIQTRCELNGFDLQRRFEDAGIYTELADPYNVLFIFPLVKDGQHFPLAEAANKIETALQGLSNYKVIDELIMDGQKISQLAVPYGEMEDLAEEMVSIGEAAGCICAEMIIPYPPGVPLLLRGERITNEKLNQLKWLLQSGARFQGSFDVKQGNIKILKTT